LVRQARAAGVALTGPEALLEALTKIVLETALEGRSPSILAMTVRIRSVRTGANSRNRKRAKTVLTDSGEVATGVPRDRDGSFEPR
jgi:putative transposase